jgi:hypothetical protein
MKNRKAPAFRKTVSVLVLIAFSLSLSFGKANDKEQISFRFELIDKAFVLNNYLNTVPSSKFSEVFIDSASWWNFETINSTLLLMDSFYKNDTKENERILVNCLAGTLLQNKGYNNSIDSLELLLVVSERYMSFAQINRKRANFFGEISDAWCSYVANQLTELSKSNSSLKHSFKFQYVAQHSRNLMYPPNISYTNSEKVILNLTEGNLIICGIATGKALHFQLKQLVSFLYFFYSQPLYTVVFVSFKNILKNLTNEKVSTFIFIRLAFMLIYPSCYL